MGNDVSATLQDIIHKCEFYSLALDGSIDIADISQLLTFVRTINSDFKIHKEFLKLQALEASAKGTNIFRALNSAISQYGSFGKCSDIATDGAKAMVGH